MRIITLAGLIAATALMTGCDLEFTTGIDINDDITVVDNHEPYVDAYVYIPSEVKELIAGLVDGYSMPPVDRYGYTLYPTDVIRDNNNLPSFVAADFNGDGYCDYAYMFSRISFDNYGWIMNTRMIVVTSTYNGYEVSKNLDLGNVTAPNSTPVEEYWAIRLLKRGTHNITVSSYGVEKETTVELLNDGLYLASIDPAERSVFYADKSELHEIVLDLGAIAKKAAKSDRATRTIKLSK